MKRHHVMATLVALFGAHFVVGAITFRSWLFVVPALMGFVLAAAIARGME